MTLKKYWWLVVIGILIIGCLVLTCAGALTGAVWYYWRTSTSPGEAGLPFPPTPTPPTPVPLTPVPRGQEQVLRLPGDEPVTLDPALSSDIVSHQYVQEIFSGLVTLNERLEVVPDMATWEVSADGTVYTFHLQDDIVFHDGKPVTAEDVKFSIERACDPRLESPVAGAYLGDIIGVREKLAGQAEEVRGVQVLDSRTVQITIDSPKAYFLAKLTYPTAYVVDRENVEKGTDWFRHPNGTGPFRLVKWDDEEIVLAAHERFYGGRPRLDKVVFRLGGGPAVSQYERGELDVAPVGPYDIDRVRDPTSPLHEELAQTATLDVWYIGFNTQTPPFNDVFVRRAFAYATDKRGIADILFQKTVFPARGILPPGMPGYNPDLEGIPFDPEKAREMLARSRYGGPDELPPIVLTVGRAGALAETLVEMYAENLGVDIEIEAIEQSARFYRGLDNREYQMFSLGWIADYPDPEDFLDLLFHSQSRQNHTGYANPQVDALLEKARLETDQARRMELYQQAEQIIVDDAPWIPLYHGSEYTLIKPYVRGLEVSPLGVYRLRKAYLERD